MRAFLAAVVRDQEEQPQQQLQQQRQQQPAPNSRKRGAHGTAADAAAAAGGDSRRAGKRQRGAADGPAAPPAGQAPRQESRAAAGSPGAEPDLMALDRQISGGGGAEAPPGGEPGAARPAQPSPQPDGGAGADTVLAARVAQWAQERLKEAKAAFVEADAGDPASWLRPLMLLAQAGKGGELLKVRCAA